MRERQRDKKERKSEKENANNKPDDSFLILTLLVNVTEVAATDAGDSTIERRELVLAASSLRIALEGEERIFDTAKSLPPIKLCFYWDLL